MTKETTMKLRLISCGLFMFLLMTGETCMAKEADAATSSPRIVNIINFIRQCEPRVDWITEDVLYDIVAEQINIMKRHHLKESQNQYLLDLSLYQPLQRLECLIF